MLVDLSKSYDQNSSQKICMKCVQKYSKMCFYIIPIHIFLRWGGNAVMLRRGNLKMKFIFQRNNCNEIQGAKSIEQVPLTSTVMHVCKCRDLNLQWLHLLLLKVCRWNPLFLQAVRMIWKCCLQIWYLHIV